MNDYPQFIAWWFSEAKKGCFAGLLVGLILVVAYRAWTTW